AEVRGSGEVMERRPAWSSTNPTYVDIAGGRVRGVQEGAAIVEARVENLFVSMPVEVRRAAADQCQGDFSERFETTLEEEPALFACAEADSIRCLNTAIDKGSKKKPMSAVGVLAAARKCCCVQIPPLASDAAPDAVPTTTSDGGPASADDEPAAGAKGDA